MDGISDAALLEALRRSMTVAAAKQAVATSNLANLETPGYRTQDVDFAKLVDQAAERLVAAAPHAAHQRGLLGGVNVREVEGLPARRDGNNVQLDRELLAMTGAASEFGAAQTALLAKFRLIRYAINEGR